MLSFRNRLLVSLGLAPLLCAFLYWTDSDPLYPNIWDTLKEAAIITTVLFALVFGMTWLFRKRGRVTKRLP